MKQDHTLVFVPAVLWLGGLALLVAVDWRIAAGVWLLGWANNIPKETDV